MPTAQAKTGSLEHLAIDFAEFIRPAFADRHKYTKIRA